MLLLAADEGRPRRGAVLGRRGHQHRVSRLLWILINGINSIFTIYYLNYLGVYFVEVGVEKALEDELGVVAQLLRQDRDPLPRLVCIELIIAIK